MAGQEQLHTPTEEAPVDPEMLARIDAARANPSTGIPHGDVLREFELQRCLSDR